MNTVLVLRNAKGVYIDTPSFGRKRDQWLWNRAWVYEHYDQKSIGPEGRSWFGTVNAKGIEQVKAQGWSIEPAHIQLGEKPE